MLDRPLPPRPPVTTMVPGIRYACVISLPQARERRERFMASVPFDVVVVPGVDARHRSAAWIRRRFDRERARTRYGRPLTKGEVGCTLAHLSALDEFIDATHGQDDTVLGLIMEDDTVFSDKAMQDLVDLHAEEHDITFLGYAREEFPFPESKSRRLAKLRSGNVFARLTPQPEGAQGYLITRRAAALILERADRTRPSWVADDYQFFSGLGLDVCGVTRPLLELSEHSAVSHLEDERKVLQDAQEKKNAGDSPGADSVDVTGPSFPPRYSGHSPLINRAWTRSWGVVSAVPFAVRTSRVGRLVPWTITTAAGAASFVVRRVRRTESD